MDSRDRIIAELRELVAKQAAQLEQQAKRIADLELQLAKALKNSSDSSTSPSSDIVKPPKKQAKRRKKAKRGGPKGHDRKLREPLTGAALDRLTHRCQIIETTGESYRLKDAQRRRRKKGKESS